MGQKNVKPIPPPITPIIPIIPSTQLTNPMPLPPPTAITTPLPPLPPVPPLTPPIPIIYNLDKYSIPNNSGTIDIDTNNLQRCLALSGNSLRYANNCITTYVQGYDTSKNTYMPIKLSQPFELVENVNSNTKPTISIVVCIIMVIIYLLIMLR